MRRQQRAAKQRWMQDCRRWWRGVVRECAAWPLTQTTSTVQEPYTLEELMTTLDELRRAPRGSWTEPRFMCDPPDRVGFGVDFSAGRDFGAVLAFDIGPDGRWWLRGLTAS